MTIPAQTAETEDVHAGTVRLYHGTSSHLLSHALHILADFGGKIRHYVIFPAAAVGPYGQNLETAWLSRSL